MQLGRHEIKSQSSTYWTISSNPSFAYLRPWWLATFSISLLTSSTTKIQTFLENFFSIKGSLISYIVNLNENLINSNSYSDGNGVIQYDNTRSTTEQWVSFDVNNMGIYSILSNNITSSQLIVAALVISFIFAGFVGFTILILFKAAIMFIYKDALEKSNHTFKYS